MRWLVEATEAAASSQNTDEMKDGKSGQIEVEAGLAKQAEGTTSQLRKAVKDETIQTNQAHIECRCS